MKPQSEDSYVSAGQHKRKSTNFIPLWQSRNRYWLAEEGQLRFNIVFQSRFGNIASSNKIHPMVEKTPHGQPCLNTIKKQEIQPEIHHQHFSELIETFPNDIYYFWSSIQSQIFYQPSRNFIVPLPYQGVHDTLGYILINFFG